MAALARGLRRTPAWALVALFALATLAAVLQLAGCVADEHPWPQIVLWALAALGFVSLTWRSTRRALELTRAA